MQQARPTLDDPVLMLSQIKALSAQLCGQPKAGFHSVALEEHRKPSYSTCQLARPILK